MIAGRCRDLSEAASLSGTMSSLTDGPSRHLWLALAVVVATGCASARGASPDLPPYAFTIAVPADSAMRLVRGVLEAEEVTVEADAVEGARMLQGSFVVRRGGLGEAEIFVTGRVGADGDAAEGSSRIELDVSVRERRRSIVVAPGDVRTGASRPEVTTVNPNDRDTIGVLTRIRDRLISAGAVRMSRRNPS